MSATAHPNVKGALRISCRILRNLQHGRRLLAKSLVAFGALHSLEAMMRFFLEGVSIKIWRGQTVGEVIVGGKDETGARCAVRPWRSGLAFHADERE